MKIRETKIKEDLGNKKNKENEEKENDDENNKNLTLSDEKILIITSNKISKNNFIKKNNFEILNNTSAKISKNIIQIIIKPKYLIRMLILSIFLNTAIILQLSKEI